MHFETIQEYGLWYLSFYFRRSHFHCYLTAEWISDESDQDLLDLIDCLERDIGQDFFEYLF